MMLSRSGRDKGLPLDHGQIGEGRRAPWGCVAGAPYRGTASPPHCDCTHRVTAVLQKGAQPPMLLFDNFFYLTLTA